MSHVVALSKESGHQYVFLYDSPYRVIVAIGNTAADDELDFDWSDARELSRKVVAMQREESK